MPIFFIKKMVENPSGPGALVGNISFIALSTSALVKGDRSLLFISKVTFGWRFLRALSILVWDGLDELNSCLKKDI